MNIGYARVSTPDQHLALQVDALTQAGCTTIYEEVLSGARAERPVLRQALEALREGDVLLIWKLDRLGRSLTHLIAMVTDLQQRGIGFRSLREHIDTTTSSGKLIFHMFGALAEFERDLLRERTQAGLVAARAHGRLGGRPKGLSASAQKTALAAETLYREGQLSVSEIAAQLHIAKSTLYAYLRARGVPVACAFRLGSGAMPIYARGACPSASILPASTPPPRATGRQSPPDASLLAGRKSASVPAAAWESMMVWSAEQGFPGCNACAWPAVVPYGNCSLLPIDMRCLVARQGSDTRGPSREGAAVGQHPCAWRTVP